MKPLKKHLILFDAGYPIWVACSNMLAKNDLLVVKKGHKLQPILRLDYYIAYLLFTWVFTAFILSHYTELISGLLPLGHNYREYFICGGQIFFQGVVARMTCKHKAYNYLGNMMTISFGGALLLLPVMLIAQWININPLFYAGWFFIVAGLMFMEHIRRTKMMELDWTLTISWAFYRLMILLFIFFI